MEDVEQHFKRLGKDFFTYGFMAALSQMSGLLLLPLLTRALSMDNYGTVDIIATFVALLSIGMKLALPNGLTRYFNEYENPADRAKLVSTLLAGLIIIGLIIVLVLSLLSGLFAEKLVQNRAYRDFFLIGCWIALLSSIRSIPQTILRMERKIILYSVINLSATFLHVALTLYFVFVLKKGIWGIFYAQLIAAAISLLMTLALTYRYFTLSLSFHDFSRILRYSLPLLPSLISTWFNRQADRVLLLLLVGLGGVAIYGAAAKIAVLVVFLLIVFQQGWQPYAMMILREDNRNEIYTRMLNYYAGGFAILTLLLTAISPELFSLILPVEYQHGYVVIPWLIGAFVLHRSALFTKLGMLVSEKTVGISIASWISVCLNVMISWILISSFGIAGAAIGTFIAELVFTCILWQFTKKKSNIVFDTPTVLRVLFSFIICSILLLLIPHTIQSPGYSILCRLMLTLVTVCSIGCWVVDELLLRLFVSAPGRVLRILKSQFYCL